MRREFGNIRAAFTQRGNHDRQHIEAEKKVLAKASIRGSLGQIGIGQRHQARFHAQGFGAAEPFKGALFEHAEEFRLHPRSERRHFVQTQSSLSAPFRGDRVCA